MASTLAAAKALIDAMSLTGDPAIYGGEVPESAALPNVVVRRTSGGGATPSQEEAPIHRISVDIWATAERRLAADELMTEIVTRLNASAGLETANYRLHRSREQIQPIDTIFEPTEGVRWFAVFATYELAIEFL